MAWADVAPNAWSMKVERRESCARSVEMLSVEISGGGIGELRRTLRVCNACDAEIELHGVVPAYLVPTSNDQIAFEAPLEFIDAMGNVAILPWPPTIRVDSERRVVALELASGEAVTRERSGDAGDELLRTFVDYPAAMRFAGADYHGELISFVHWPRFFTQDEALDSRTAAVVEAMMSYSVAGAEPRSGAAFELSSESRLSLPIEIVEAIDARVRTRSNGGS